MSNSDEYLRMLDDRIKRLDQSLKQMEVDRKLREELRLDSQKLREEFWKLLDGESQAHTAFIPKRFEDLKPNGGIRFRRVPIKLTYHKARLKKRKRWLMRENGDPSVTQKPEISTRSLRLGVKNVGMKKQYHQKKRTAQVKLAQACKSLGMFLNSPSLRDPKDCMKICVVKRQIGDTGVKRETYLFRYGFTSLDPTDIDCCVDMWIGGQSIFAENVTVLEHDDSDAAMKSLKDETVMKYEPEITSKYKSQVELSHVQQHKQQRRFHKVRFKGRRRRRTLYTKRIVLQKRHSVNWSYHKTRKKEMISLDISSEALRQLDKGSDGKDASGRHMGLRCGARKKLSCVVSHSNHVWKPGRSSKKPPEPLWSFVVDGSMCLSMLFGSDNEVSDYVGGKEAKVKRWLNCFEEVDPSLVLYVWDPGQAEVAKGLLELLKSSYSKKKWVNGVEAETLKQEHDSGGSFSGLAFEFCVADTGWERGIGFVGVRNAESVWNGEWLCERVTVSIMNNKGQDKGRQGELELYVEVKFVDVLGCKGSRASQRTISSCGDEIMVSVFDFFSLEDQTDLLTGRKLRLYGACVGIEVYQGKCKTQTMLLSVYCCVLRGFGSVQGSVEDAMVLAFDPGGAMCAHQRGEVQEWCAHALQAQETQRRIYTKRLRLIRVLAQLIGTLDNLSLAEACKGAYALIVYTVVAVGECMIDVLKRVMKVQATNDTERLESVEVMRNNNGRELATFWAVFELLCAVFQADFKAWVNLCVISLINTKGARMTDSQTYDLLDGLHAMKVAVTSLSILKMQVIKRFIKGGVSAVRDRRWTLSHTSDWFHSPRPSEHVVPVRSTHGAITSCGSSDHETGEEMTEVALALVQLEDKLALHRGSIDKIIWASYGPISDFRVKPSSEENIFYVLVFKLCFAL